MKPRSVCLLLVILCCACDGQPTPTVSPTLSSPPTLQLTPTPDFEKLGTMILDPQGDVTRVHDPTMIKAGNKYYLYSTGPGVSIRCSADMLVWKFCGQVFGAYPKWVLESVPGVGDLWAPDIVFHSGKYFLYYAVSSFGANQSAIGLATNVTLDPSSPEYAWVDQGEVYSSQKNNNYNAIDPNLTFDRDGNPWLVFGSFWSGIKLVQIAPTLDKPGAGAKLFNLADKPGNTAIEGAFITRRGDYYYLFVSHDFCCKGVSSTYNIKVGRASAITGPYLDRTGKPLLGGGGTLVYGGSSRWRGPGHNSIYIENGKYYMVYHSYDADFGGTPTLRVEELLWDADDWPLSPSALLGK